MKSKETQQIIREISRKHGVNEKVVEKVVKYQFQFLRDTMASGSMANPETLKSVLLPKMGTFYIKIAKLFYYRKMAELGTPVGLKRKG